jgi:hypothetical protein
MINIRITSFDVQLKNIKAIQRILMNMIIRDNFSERDFDFFFIISFSAIFHVNMMLVQEVFLVKLNIGDQLWMSQEKKWKYSMI